MRDVGLAKALYRGFGKAESESGQAVTGSGGMNTV